MQSTVQVTINALSVTQIEELIAHLSIQGFEGFEEKESSLEAFITSANFSETVLQALLKQYNADYTVNIIEPQNWNAVWESNFEPVQVNDFVGIRAHFHPPFTSVLHEIVITPKMSFGTGHHATTYLVMQAMQHISFTSKTVFDFGTGTGILAILAEKLGAEKILAVDNDIWCIENATENVQNNNCNNIKVSQANDAVTNSEFQIILANINRHIILDNMEALYNGLANNGIILFSGLLADDEAIVVEAIKSTGLQHIATTNRNNWICIEAAKSS